MFDDKPVHRAMERIFTPLDITAATPPAADRSRSIEASPPPRRRRWFMGKDGIAAAGFALAVTGIGLVMAPLLTAPAVSPPAVRTAAPTPELTPAPALTPTPTPTPAPASLPPPPPRPAPMPLPVVATPPVKTIVPIAAPRKTKVTRVKAIRRYARARPYRGYRRRGAPRLAGAALRRALARDVVLTRRLNLQALRRLPPAPR